MGCSSTFQLFILEWGSHIQYSDWQGQRTTYSPFICVGPVRHSLTPEPSHVIINAPLLWLLPLPFLLLSSLLLKSTLISWLQYLLPGHCSSGTTVTSPPEGLCPSFLRPLTLTMGGKTDFQKSFARLTHVHMYMCMYKYAYEKWKRRHCSCVRLCSPMDSW